MAYETYKFIHFIGLIGLFFAFGLSSLLSLAGLQDKIYLRRAAILHGVSLFLLLLGGFGMLARMQIHWPWPGWVTGKVIIWLVLGAIMTPIKRNLIKGSLVLPLVMILGSLAIYMALLKPF